MKLFFKELTVKGVNRSVILVSNVDRYELDKASKKHDIPWHYSWKNTSKLSLSIIWSDLPAWNYESLFSLWINYCLFFLSTLLQFVDRSWYSSTALLRIHRCISIDLWTLKFSVTVPLSYCMTQFQPSLSKRQPHISICTEMLMVSPGQYKTKTLLVWWCITLSDDQLLNPFD